MKTKKTLIIILSILLLILLGIYVSISIYVDNMLNKVEQGETITTEEAEIHEVIVKPEAHKVVNMMIFGADNLDFASDRISYIEERSDVMKVFSIDYTSKTLKLSSLDRDVVVWIPGSIKDFGHFNWAYAYGGPSLAIKTINYNLDLDITKYVTFSFAGFINVIDKMGGVDIDLTNPEQEYFNSNNMMSQEVIYGINHLNGEDALTYARTRHIDSDFKRMDRQTKVIKAVINKMRKLELPQIIELVNDFLPYINTNLTPDEIKDYITDFISFNLKLQTHTYPTAEEKDICINKNSLGGYLLRSYVNQVKDLHKFIYEVDYDPSRELKELEMHTYEAFGEFYEDSELLP